MAKFALFCFLLVFGVLGVKSLSCGGVLETSRGALEYSVLEDEAPPELCLWIIKLPTPSSSIRFQLDQIPESSHLSLYPQGGQAAGQITVLPIRLTSQNVSSIVESNAPNMIVVWSLPSTSAGNSSSTEIQLNFNWSSIKGHGQNGSKKESDFVGGVNYVEASRGKFTWEDAGLEQQTLHWILNSNSESSLHLQTETNLERCDLVDPCLCSYFGVYEVYDNFLRIVTTECGRTATSDLRDVRPILVALAFVNPQYRNEGNHISLSWRKETKENSNSTTTTTSTTITTEAPPRTCSAGRFRSCAEIQKELNLSGFQVCAIYPFGLNSSAVEVLCDFETDGGGWTVIQKREKGPKEEFFRNWADYAQGFYGDESEGASGNYWIGLDIIHALTNQNQSFSNQSLRMDLTDWNNKSVFAQYSSFSVGDSSTNYTLNYGGYSTDSSAWDALSVHQGRPFSTKDRDNSDFTCAQTYKGAWWYSGCYYSNLNGLYLNPAVDVTEEPKTGIQWTPEGTLSTLQKTTSIKIRDADFIISLSFN